jgi:hypothetical protein
VADDDRMVEVIDRWAYVTRDEIQQVANRWNRSVACNAHGQMFFARRERLEFRMAKDDAGRDARIR